MSGVKSKKIKSNKIRFTEHQKKFMNKNAQKWVQMVYNDDLLQAINTLEKDQGFCCLGVGALCFQMETGLELPLKPNGDYARGSLVCEFETVQNWLGLWSSNGNPRFGGVLGDDKSLAGHNDQGKSFREIAQFMLDYPEQYFIPVSEQ